MSRKTTAACSSKIKAEAISMLSFHPIEKSKRKRLPVNTFAAVGIPELMHHPQYKVGNADEGPVPLSADPRCPAFEHVETAQHPGSEGIGLVGLTVIMLTELAMVPDAVPTTTVVRMTNAGRNCFNTGTQELQQQQEKEQNRYTTTTATIKS